VAYRIEFPTPEVTTRAEYDAHTDALDDLKNQLWEELDRLEKIRIKDKLEKVRFRVWVEVD
jgi:hypothetical protein